MTYSRAALLSSLMRWAAPIAIAAALPAAAHAADAPTVPADNNKVGEVVVTATFREQNLQQTPLAITAVNSKMLEQRAQTDVSQVAAQAPNVTLVQNGAAFGSSMVAFIRGVGQTDFDYALEPGVGIYVDDVYYATLAGSLLDLLDVDRVEILRGPQGTLAGKNSIGGAVKLFSKKPTGSGGGYLQGTYGSLNRIDVRGAADFTVIPDKLFMRISGAAKHRDGYITRYDYACMNPGSNVPTHSVDGAAGCVIGHDGSQAYDALRVALRWVPTEKLEWNVAADGTNDQSGVQANTLVKVNPAAVLGALTYTTGVNGAPVFFSSAFLPPNPYSSYATYFQDACSIIFGCSPYRPYTVPPINHYKSWGVSSNIDYKLTDTLTLQSITAFRYYTNQFAEQTDVSPVGVQLLLQRLQHRQTTQEFRLNGSFGKALDYTVGFFYLDQYGTLSARVGLPWVGYDFNHGPEPTSASTVAGFANVNWHITDRLNLSGGVRYSDEKKDYTYKRHNADGSDVTDPAGYNGGVFGLNNLQAHFQGSRWDYRVAADYHVTDNIMVYVDTATGYKGGGVDPRPFVVTQAQPFQPETLTGYEAGVKTYLFDRRMRLNMAGFFNDYTNIQLTLNPCPTQSGGSLGPCALPANVGTAHVKGFEAETEIHPVDGLEIDGSLSYLDFKYTKIADPNTGITLNMVTPYTPTWKWSLGAQYAIPLGNMGSLTPRIDLSYQSSVFTAAQNDPLWNQIKGYTVGNARLTYRSPDGSWETSLEISNFTNKLYYLTLFDNHSGPGYVNGQPALPREWAITVKKTF
jgi:iron complex outermembrane receptor protein